MTSRIPLLAPLLAPLCASLLLCTSACVELEATDGRAPAGEFDSAIPIVTLGDADDPSVVATLDFVDVDATIVLRQIDEDSVGVSELVPGGAVSKLDELIEQDATPLEIYLAAAPAGYEVPAVLTRDHERLTSERDDSTPRALVLPPASAGSALYRRGADCSFNADGRQYFDGFWQGYGWNYHWYKYFTNVTSYTYSSWDDYRAFVTTSRLRSHVCVARGGATHRLRQRRSIGGSSRSACRDLDLFSEYVPEGFRSVFYYRGSRCLYEFRAEPRAYSWYPATLGAGLTAP